MVPRKDAKERLKITSADEIHHGDTEGTEKKFTGSTGLKKSNKHLILLILQILSKLE